MSWVYNRQCLFNMTHEAVSTCSCVQHLPSFYLHPAMRYAHGVSTAQLLPWHTFIFYSPSCSHDYLAVIMYPGGRSPRLEAEETATLRHKTSFPACPALPVIRLLPSHGCMDQLELAINDQSLRCLSMRSIHADLSRTLESL